MEDQGVGLHAPYQRGIDGKPVEIAAVREAFGMYAGLVNDVDFANHPLKVGFEFVANAVLFEIVEDVELHLQFVRADEEDFHALEFGEQVGERAGSASFIQFADDGNAEAIDGTLAIDRVKIEQGLGGMLAAVAVSRIDDRDTGNLASAL